MAYYPSFANTTFAAVEQVFGQAASIASAQQIVTQGVHIQQQTKPSLRRDKTGSRSAAPFSGSLRQTAFSLNTFLTGNAANDIPVCDPLFTAALGAPYENTQPVTVASFDGNLGITTQQQHNLSAGNAISFGQELRFVAAVLAANQFSLNAPFTEPPVPGATLGSTVNYRLASKLPSLTLFDYWGPQNTLARVLTGVAVERMELMVSGERHEMHFGGRAAECLNTAAFIDGQAGLASFPTMPATPPLDYVAVPGALGQAWLGNPAAQCYTLTQASIRLDNQIALRDHEVSTATARGVSPGRRRIQADISLLVQDDPLSSQLPQIAANRGTLSLMLQLGQQTGQRMAVYLPSVLPAVPEYDDKGEWLTWHLKANLAMGATDNELFLAFA